MTATLYAKRPELSRRPVTAAEWQPYFEKALAEYVMEQQGGVTEISCRNILKFISKAKDYPPIEDGQERHVSNLLNAFFSRFFGPLWDGVKYRDNRSVGKSLLVGTDNVLDYIRRLKVAD